MVGVRFCLLVATQLLVISSLLQLQTVDGSKILGYLITPSRSHFIIHESLMRGLAEKGHEVTVVSFYPPPKENITNYRAIQLDMQPETGKAWKELADNLLQAAGNEEPFFTRMPKMVSTISKMNAETYTHPLVEQLKKESFDLVIFGWFFNDYQIGMAAHFKCPAVYVTSTPSFKPLRDYVGNPSAPAFTPLPMFGSTGHMDFKGRVINYVASALESVITELVMNFIFEPLYSQEFPPDKYPSFAEAKKNVSLVLVTAHFSQGQPTLSFPGMQEISGMHIPRKPKELPKNIKNWLDTAKHGVIFFSMGSNIKSTQIDAEKRDAILRVFSRLKQRVLWKWEDENLPGKPDNVMVQSWLPQADILAHKNVVLFISHCGKGSVNEAKSNGVPILGIPVFADQPTNLQALVAEGWAVPLQYSELNEQTFERALTEALTNPSYTKVVKTAADLFSDRPMHPLDTAIYWVEYVLRYDGAKHMQSQAVHLNWFQTNSLDVLALLAVVAFVGWKLTVWFWRAVFAVLCRRIKGGKTKKD